MGISLEKYSIKNKGWKFERCFKLSANFLINFKVYENVFFWKKKITSCFLPSCFFKSRKNNIQRIKTLLLVLFFPVFINAQGYDSGGRYDALGWEARAEIGRQNIKDLKNGVLVVRLKSGSNKIKAYERIADSPEISLEKRKFFEKKMTEVKKEINLENENLIQAINEDYLFSDVLFLMDTCVFLLKEKKQSGYFLNESLEVDPVLSLNERPFLIAHYEASSLATNNGIEGLVVLGQNLKELVEAFSTLYWIVNHEKDNGKDI